VVSLSNHAHHPKDHTWVDQHQPRGFDKLTTNGFLARLFLDKLTTNGSSSGSARMFFRQAYDDHVDNLRLKAKSQSWYGRSALIYSLNQWN